MMQQQQQQPECITSAQLVHEILRVNCQQNLEKYGGGGAGCTSSGLDEVDQSMKHEIPFLGRESYGDDGEDDASSSINKSSLGQASQCEVILLDCQNPSEYHEAHIRGAVNVTFPAIMVRRIQTGKIDLFDKSRELKEKMANSKITFVVYDAVNRFGGNFGVVPPTSSASYGDLSEIVMLVAKKLAQNGCHVFTLRGGLSEFRELYPEWVESNELTKSSAILSSSSSPSNNSPGPFTESGEVPLLGLGSLASLRIQDESEACDSSIGMDSDDAFPVEIIPNLYLGNAGISSDGNILERHNIKHILNVTPDLPNHFENEIRYLQIPISDHWTQSLLAYFPSAITFIDEGRSKDEGVLVHCLAGISRSVTITMAYLMFKLGLSLNEAYDIVRARKANISPNFHFMKQLLDFERQINSQFISPGATMGSTPDSGIEFDRWNST